jgi:hypothetical protein
MVKSKPNPDLPEDHAALVTRMTDFKNRVLQLMQQFQQGMQEQLTKAVKDIQVAVWNLFLSHL